MNEELWCTYARLQKQLAQSGSADDRAWGWEAGLNRILDATDPATTTEDAERTARSGSRKARHHAVLRRCHPVDEADPVPLESVVDARRHLRLIERHVAAKDKSLLYALAEGLEYDEIADGNHLRPGTLRVRVCRLRLSLAELAA